VEGNATEARLETWEDPRVVAGTGRQLEALDRVLAGGARRLGWKLGLGAPPAREAWGIPGPAAGYITDATLVVSGTSLPLRGWESPKLEAEIAVRVAVDEHGPRVGSLGVAIELADIGSGGDDLASIIATDIFHRRTILGPLQAEPETAVTTVTVERDGEPIALAEDPTALVGGDPATMTAYLDRYLAGLEMGEALADGEVIITGSTVPLVDCSAGGRFVVSAPGLGEVEVTLEA
jgi:2-keto-4-pentenoate hydratase